MPKKMEEKVKKDFDLFDHKSAIIKAFRNDETDIELEGRKFNMRLQNLHNVDYVIVSPVEGFVPSANLILDEEQYRREMERRGTPLEDRKPLPASRREKTPPRTVK